MLEAANGSTTRIAAHAIAYLLADLSVIIMDGEIARAKELVETWGKAAGDLLEASRKGDRPTPIKLSDAFAAGLVQKH
jgi:hypothetical protein